MGSSDLRISGLSGPWTICPGCSAMWAPVIQPRHIKSHGIALEVRIKGMISQISHLPCWFGGNAWRGADGFCRSTPISASLHSRCHGQEFSFYHQRTNFVEDLGRVGIHPAKQGKSIFVNRLAKLLRRVLN